MRSLIERVQKPRRDLFLESGEIGVERGLVRAVELYVVIAPVVEPLAGAGVYILSGVDIHGHDLEDLAVDGPLAAVHLGVVLLPRARVTLLLRAALLHRPQKHRRSHHLRGRVSCLNSVLGVRIFHRTHVVSVQSLFHYIQYILLFQYNIYTLNLSNIFFLQLCYLKLNFFIIYLYILLLK